MISFRKHIESGKALKSLHLNIFQPQKQNNKKGSEFTHLEYESEMV